jgi:hypothetical protein
MSGIFSTPFRRRSAIHHCDGEIGRRSIAELLVHTDFFKFVIERIGFTEVVGVSELANEIGSAHQHAIFVIVSVGGGHYWKARELDGVGDADSVERFDFTYTIHHE